MPEKIRFVRNWRGRTRMFYPLVYRVPKDISEDEAQRAIGETAAVVAREATATSSAEGSRQPGRGRRRSRKHPAPENKAIAGARENKSALV